MKIKSVLCIALIALIFSGCGDDDSLECPSCAGIEAHAENDNSGKGIYKGIVVGSSGTIIFDIANSNSIISAELILDGEKITLSTEAQYSGGFEGYLYGTMETENDVRVGFTVTNPAPGLTNYDVFGIIIPGHPDVSIHTLKEFSYRQVKVFEGNFSGDANGTLNLATTVDRRGTQQGYWLAISKESDNAVEISEGQMDGNGIVGGNDDIRITGTINKNSIKGTWTNKTNGSSGTWEAKRTL